MQKLNNLNDFAKNGVVLQYHEWWRPRAAEPSHAEDAKLMFGLLYSLKSFAPKVGCHHSHALAKSVCAMFITL